MTYSPHRYQCSTISAGGLNFCVRDENRCCPPSAITTGKLLYLFLHLESCIVLGSLRCFLIYRSSPRPISTGWLKVSLPLHRRPIHQIISLGVLPDYSVGDLILGWAWRLDAFSAYPFYTWLPSYTPGGITGTPSVYPSRSSRTRDGSPLKSPTPTTDRDRTVSRRSEPSSRAALMGEQPNPWNLLQLQDATSRHRGAKLLRRCGLLGEISLLSPPGSFYPLSDGPSTQCHRITKPMFPSCSSCCSRSQAPLCLYTLRARFPTALREPLGASVTFWEATAPPVKLPTRECPPPPGLRIRVRIPAR